MRKVVNAKVSWPFFWFPNCCSEKRKIDDQKVVEVICNHTVSLAIM